eukprot:scaffold80927_cov42-Attheya_sp.AAC.7
MIRTRPFLLFSLSTLLLLGTSEGRVYGKTGSKSSKNAKESKESKTSKTDGGCSKNRIEVETDVLVGKGLMELEVTADIYTCADDKNFPLIIFAPGAGVPKSNYTLMASEFLRNGYSIVVLEHKYPFGSGGMLLNLVNPQDMAFAINYADSIGLISDGDSLILAGHSFGANTVLFAINELCIVPFCSFSQNIKVPLDSRVTITLGFGTSLIRFGSTGPEGWTDDLNNKGFPFFYVNGEKDLVNDPDVVYENENLNEGTFKRLHPTKATATMKGLNHYSIVDLDLPNIRGEEPSTLSRRAQVRNSVGPMVSWIESQLTERRRQRFCDKFVHNYKGVKVISCEEDFGDR